MAVTLCVLFLLFRAVREARTACVCVVIMRVCVYSRSVGCVRFIAKKHGKSPWHVASFRVSLIPFRDTCNIFVTPARTRRVRSVLACNEAMFMLAALVLSSLLVSCVEVVDGR